MNELAKEAEAGAEPLAPGMEDNPEEREIALHLKGLVVSHGAKLTTDELSRVADGLRSSPGDLQHLANHLLYSGEAAQAAELARTMLAHRIALADTFLVLAAADRQSGGDTTATLEAGVQSFPDHPYLLIELAKAYRGLGQADLAQKFAQAAHANLTGDIGITLECVHILSAAGEHQSALAMAEEGLQDPQGHDLTLRQLAIRAAIAAGRPLSAYQHVTAALLIAAPDDEENQTIIVTEGELQQVANELFWADALSEASDLTRSMLVSDITFPDTYLVLATSEGRLGADALATLEMGVLRYPDHPFLLIELAKARNAAGQTALAAQAARAAHDRLPSNIGITLECVQLCLAAGQYDDAVAIAEEALGQPDENALQLHRAALHAAYAAGRPATAYRHARAAMDIDPSDESTVRALADVATQLKGFGGADRVALRVMGRRRDPELLKRYFAKRLQLLSASSDGAVSQSELRVLNEQALDEIDVIGPSIPLQTVSLACKLNAFDIVLPGLRKILATCDVSVVPGAARELIEALAGRFLANTVAFAPGHPGTQAQLAAELVQGRFRSERRSALNLLGAALAPLDGVAQLNAGFAALAAGDVANAQYYFARTSSTDIYGQGRISWPRTEDDIAWPFAPFPNVEHFFKADLVDETWPRISIITPSLNQGRYIEAAIASILNQNYPNLEYIVVDAGSTDETLAILERYRDRIDKIVVAELSQTEALNFGFEQLTGDLIGWLNTDDILAPGAFHAAAAAYSRSACDVIVGHSLIHREGEVERVLIPKRQRSQLETGALLDLFGKWLKKDFFCQPEVFIARQALQKIGGRLDTSLQYTMDYDLWLRLAKKGASMHVTGWPFAFFRKHEAQKTSNEFACFLELVDVREGHAASLDEADSLAHPDLVRSRTQVSIPDLTSFLPMDVFLWAGDDQVPAFRAVADEAGLRLEDLGPGEAETARNQAPSPVRVDIIGTQGVPSPDELLARQLTSQLSIGWFWNCHQAFVAKRELSDIFDLVIPADTQAGSYLSNLDGRIPQAGQAVLGKAINLGGAGALGALRRDAERSDRVCLLVESGAPSSKVEAVANQLADAGHEFDLWRTEELARLGAKTLGACEILAAYKVCLYLAGSTEVAAPVLEALLMGVVPVVALPAGLAGPAPPSAGWGRLPITCYDSSGSQPLPAVMQQASRRFEAAGPAGIEQRSTPIADTHLLVHRLAAIVAQLSDAVRQRNEA